MKARHQSGVALITILLVVTIATVMAVSMAREQQSSVLTTRSFLDRGQALQYALGGEELARQILHEDFLEGTSVDHTSEVWADPELHYEFEQGEVNLQIRDLQGMLNLNALLETNPGRNISTQRLINLMASVNADPTTLDRLIDWIDTDISNRPAGAEDYDYMALEPPYRSANSPFIDKSELRLLALPEDTYQLLSSEVVALPTANSGININTATTATLQSLSPDMSFEVADSLVQRRFDEEEGYAQVDEFLQIPELAGLGIQSEGLSVQSAFFEVRIIARYQDRFSYLTSTIHRRTTDGSMRVIHRDFSRNVRPVSTTNSNTETP